MKAAKLFLLIAIATLFTACSSVSNEISLDKYKTGDLPDGMYYLNEEVISIYPYDNKIYTLSLGGEDSGYHDEIGYYDIKTMEYTKLYSTDKEGPCSIYVNDNGIYCIKNATIYLMDFNCKVKDTIEVLGLEYDDGGSGICANGNYIVLNKSYLIEKHYESKIITVDLKTKKTNIYPYVNYKDGDGIFKILPTENENEFFIAGFFQLYSFNTKNGKMEVIMDSNGFYALDYIPLEGKFYVSYDPTNKGMTLGLGSISLTDEELRTSRVIGYDSLYQDMKNEVEKAGNDMKPIYLSTLYYTGSDYFLWDSYNKTVCVLSPELNGAGESITVLYKKIPPTSVSGSADYERKFGIMSLQMTEVNMKYASEKNVRVDYTGYEYDSFIRRLRLKMMAGETDYDVVLLEDAGELLASILKYNLFLPLENYESIASGFDKYIDGVVNVMSYDGHIYGVPYNLSAYALALDDELSVDYTLEDFWEACEKSGGERLFHCTILTQKAVFFGLMQSIIEDGAEKGEVDREALLDCLTQYKKYYAAGALNTSIPSSGPIRIVNGIGGGIETRESYDFISAVGALRALPSFNGKHYIDVNSMAYISSVSPNPDLSAEYLAYMVSDEFVSGQYSYEKSFLTKDEDSYFYTKLTNAIDGEYKWSVEPFNLSNYDAFLINHGADLFANSAPRLYTCGMDEVLDEVYADLVKGSLTAEEAADKIYSEAGYRIME